MLAFQALSSFLDALKLTFCSISLSRRTVSIRATCFRIRENSLGLNSFLVARALRSRKSCALRSTTLSWMSSVLIPRISSSSTVRFDIIVTETGPRALVATALGLRDACSRQLAPEKELRLLDIVAGTAAIAGDTREVMLNKVAAIASRGEARSSYGS